MDSIVFIGVLTLAVISVAGSLTVLILKTMTRLQT